MKDIILNRLSCPKFMPLIMAAIAGACLSMALIAQYVWELDPCILCIIQRYPYGIIIGLGLIGFLFSFKCQKAVSALMAMIGTTFFTNSAIAFYHSGVELHWWRSHLEGCAVPDLGNDPNNILATIEATIAVRCDEIPWADPILNLSMANYNVMLCAALGIISLISARQIWPKT